MKIPKVLILKSVISDEVITVKSAIHSIVINKVEVGDPNYGEGALSSHEKMLEFTLQKDFQLLQNLRRINYKV